MSHHSYGGSIVGEEKMELKKDIYMNDAGECVETTGGLPKGWAKGKLMGKKGQEMSDADYKALNIIATKAKAPKENKGK
jgi:hypothetical protein|tara:strand:- start:2081 stop:2317 length:237 start_codon:yes stop_codon:yes gene_type:complete